MAQSKADERSQTSRNLQRLGDEEEAWYRHNSSSNEDVGESLKDCIRRSNPNHSGSPLADDEDAWVRR